MDRGDRRELQREYDASFERVMTAAKAYLAALQSHPAPRSPETISSLRELQRESAAAHDAYLLAARRWHAA